ncbi:MAG TPA: YggT family protein [Pyrinomonadaceae bacterium]|jgi:YggT family protein
MQIISRSLLFLTWAVEAAIVAIVVLMILRLIANAADLNPFSWASRTIRQLSDGFILPARRALMGLGVDPKFAPLIVILITILLGWFFLWLTKEVAATLIGLIISFKAANPIMGLGYIIYGALSIYLVFIFMRIVFSWGMVSYSNRLMRFLVNTTEPLLGPLRRIIPPLGIMDISPIFAFIIIWLFQMAVMGTLLGGGLPPVG